MPIKQTTVLLIERLLSQEQNLRLGLVRVPWDLQSVHLSFTANDVKSHKGFCFLCHCYRPQVSIEESALVSVVSEY